MTNAERQKKHRERQKALRIADEKVLHGVMDEPEIITEIKKSVTERNDLPCPEAYDKKMWDYACERAYRARRYAEVMPEHVRPSEVCFQSPEWQYRDQSKHPLPTGVLRE
jgi:hypothetical protein